MKTSLKKIGIPGIAVAIFVGIMLLLSFYFFYTIGKNKQSVEEQGFRELNQLGLAIKAQDELIRKMVNNYSNRIVDSVKENFPLSIKQKEKAKGKKNEKTKIRPLMPKERLSLYIFEKSPITKNIFIGFEKITDITDSLVYKVKDSIVCKINYGNFITPFLRKDFFSDFILIRDGAILFNTTEADLFIPDEDKAKSKTDKSTNLFSASPSANSADSAYDKFIRSGTIHKIKIQGTKFELFLTPVKFHTADKCTWFIGGLIPEDKISSWERNLPSNWIIIIFIVLLFILFSLPILKIFIAGANENISRILVTMVGSSVVIGTFLIIIFATDMLIEFRTKAETDRNLKKLSNTIQKTFFQERTAILKQLSTYDSIGRDKGHVPIDSVTSLLYEDNAIYKPGYRYFKTMFWANKEGMQTFFITPYSNSSSSFIGYRNYFKYPEVYEDSVGNTRLWYNMEPIYSNTSGEWILAFSKPAKDQQKDKIVAITSWMYSIKSTILPQDYEYCLVEKSGKIWYHSKEVFNLSDDLLKECDDENMSAAFKSNSRDLLYITLRNSRYRAYVTPVNNTNLFLVTMFNPAKLKSMEAITAASAIVYFGMIALLLLIFFTLVWIGSQRNKLIEGNEFFFNWLIPVDKKKETYGFLLVINFFIAIALLITGLSGWVRSTSLSWVLWDLLFLIAGNFIFNYILLNLQPFRHQEKNTLFKTKILKPLEKSVTPATKYIYDRIKEFTVYKKDVRNLYTSFMVSWIVVTTVFPAILFMVRFHHEETKLYVINQFQGIANKLNQRTDSLAKFYNENIPLKYPDSLFYGRDSQGLYFKTIWNTTVEKPKAVATANGKRIDMAVVHQVHFFFNSLMGDRESSSINPLIESKINMTDTSFGILFNKLTVEYPVKEDTDKSRLSKGIISQGISTDTKGGSGIFKLFDKGLSSWLFFLLITLILTLIHLLIRKISHKLFDYDGLSAIVPTLETQLGQLGSADVNSIIVSLNALNINGKPYGEWKIIDMNDSESIKIRPAERLILCNIESKLSKPEEITQCVKTIEMFLKKRPVILFLSRTPKQITECLLERWKSTIDENKEKEGDKSSFIKLIEGLEYFQKTIYKLPVYFVKPQPWKNSYREPLKDILKRESIINPDVENYAPALNSIMTQSKPEEKIILKLQELSIARYSYIWHRLSNEEQFILYQLAKGSMLNLNNREPNRLLFNKGILLLDEHVDIVSAAFKNFILTSVDLSEIELIEKLSIKTGSWSKFRLPVMLMAASIIIFLFATQQNVLSNLNAILLSVATLLGVYLKFSGLLVPGNK